MQQWLAEKLCSMSSNDCFWSEVYQRMEKFQTAKSLPDNASYMVMAESYQNLRDMENLLNSVQSVYGSSTRANILNGTLKIPGMQSMDSNNAENENLEDFQYRSSQEIGMMQFDCFFAFMQKMQQQNGLPRILLTETPSSKESLSWTFEVCEEKDSQQDGDPLTGVTGTSRDSVDQAKKMALWKFMIRFV